MLGGEDDVGGGFSILCLLTPILACEEVPEPLPWPPRPYSEMVIQEQHEARCILRISTSLLQLLTWTIRRTGTIDS